MVKWSPSLFFPYNSLHMKLSVYGNRVYSYSGIPLYQNLGRVTLLEEQNTYVKLNENRP